MSFTNTGFKYNGIHSDMMDVIMVHTDTELLKRNFGLSKTINSEKIRFNDTPVYYNSEKQVYTLPITICKKDGAAWTLEDKMAIAGWLFIDDGYHEFISDDFPDFVWYLQFTKGELNDNYNDEGFITLENQLSSPYAYTIATTIDEDCSLNDTTIIEIENKSNTDVFYYPRYEFTLASSNTSFKIQNLTVNGEESIFTGLTTAETVAVDNKNQRIESSTGNERISNFNMQFLKLAYGKNRLKVTGKCWLRFKVQFPIAF